MPKKWSNDAELVGRVAGNLFEALPLFPKRLLRVDELARQQQMPFSHIQILIMLAAEELSIGQISDRLGIAKPNVTPMVDTLRDAGLVERIRDERDRRIVNVRLLPQGEERLQMIRASIEEQVTRWPGAFSRSEVKELSNALATLIRMAGGMKE